MEFQPPNELTLFAGQASQLVVQVTPPGKHTVRFALLGKTEDAFLDPSVVETGTDGRAETRLTALSAASSFTVRAAAGRVSGTLDVVTLEASLASLDITPSYAGSRPVVEWVASVHLGTTCSALQGVPFPDGLLVARGPYSVHIEGITAELPLAVVIRAGQYAGGCRSLTPLRANSLSSVSIDVIDRPMQTTDLSLSVALGVEPTDAPNPALDALAFRAASALAGTASDDLAALLDAMSALATDPAAFATARAAQGWRAALVGGLAPDLPGSGLRTLVQNWMRIGIELLEAPGAFEGTLTSLAPAGAASAAPGGAAILSIESVIGLSPSQTGFEQENTATAVAETEDFLRIGATLSWQPSPFFSAAATRAALDRDPARASAADAMAEEFGCDDVASIIVAAGNAPGQAFPGCDETCALGLCRSAMSELWSRVAESALPAVPWQISVASRAQIDDAARPTGVVANWIGTLTVPDFGTTPIQGPFSGVSGN